MLYHLNATRVLCATSKYAPLAVIQFDIVAPESRPLGLNNIQFESCVSKLCTGNGSKPLSLHEEGSPAEIFCELVLELQRYTGHTVHYSKVQRRKADSECRVFIEYASHAAALYAGELAVELLNAIMASRGSLDAKTITALQQSLNQFITFSLAHRLDPNSRMLIEAARRKGIPSINLDLQWDVPTWPGAVEQSGLVQFGWGVYQRRCRGPVTTGFSSLENLEQISDLAHLLPRLKKSSIPLARQDLEFVNRNQIRRAQRSARRIGYPVILRPRINTPFQYRLPDNNIFGPIYDDTQVAMVAGYLRKQVGCDIWIESYVAGEHYRFLILAGEVLSVVRCTPPAITGDGIRSITKLAERAAKSAGDVAENQIWRALAQGDSAVTCRLQLKGLSLESVPPPGTQITLRGSGTFYNGGKHEEVMQEVPAHINALAVAVAQVSGLGHLAGIDLIIDKLSGPAAAPNCVVRAVVPDPDLQVHELASEDHPHAIGDRYMAQLFPAGSSSRIPIVAVTGTNGKTTTCRMVARILRTSGRKVGLSCTDGVYLDEKLLISGDESGVLGAIDVLATPEAEAAVLETARGGLAKMGIAFDRCDVGACLNVAQDHLGQDGIETLDEMAAHKRQLIERASAAVVLNAEDPRCLAMAAHSAAEEVILIAQSADHPAIQAHCQAGGRSIVLIPGKISNEICILDGTVSTPIVAASQIPATMDEKAFFNVENAMAAAALCTGLGINNELIAKGLVGFRMTPENTPGRLNVFDDLPFRVIVDFAHNAHAIAAFCHLLRQLPVKGRRIAIYGAPGDRCDEDIKENASLIADNFDYFFCRDSISTRGRARGETMALVSSALVEHGIEKDKIESIPDPEKAVKKAFSIAKSGDLLVIFAGNLFWESIKDYLKKPVQMP